MSSVNEVVLEGYCKNVVNKGNYGLGTVVVDRYNARTEKFEEVEIGVVLRKPPKGELKTDKLVDGKPVRFKGEVSVKDGYLGLGGFMKLHYLGKFEEKGAQKLGGAPAGGSDDADDEPPF